MESEKQAVRSRKFALLITINALHDFRIFQVFRTIQTTRTTQQTASYLPNRLFPIFLLEGLQPLSQLLYFCSQVIDDARLLLYAPCLRLYSLALRGALL